MADLNLQIKATATDAVASIKALESALKGLSNELDRVNSVGLASLSQSVKDFSSAMSTVKGTSAKDFNKLVNGLQKISSVDASQFTTVSQGVTELATSVSLLGGTNVDQNVMKLVNALTRLASVDTSNITSGTLGTLGQQVVDFATALQNVQSISTSTMNLVSALTKLASTGDKATTTATALPILATEIRKFFDSMASAPQVSAQTISLVSALSQLARVGNKAETSAKNLGVLSSELVKLIEALSRAPQVTQGTVSLVQALGQLGNAHIKANIGTNTLNSSMSRLPHTMNRVRKSSKGLVSAIGMFYAKCFLLIRAFKLLWKSIDSAMNFLEVYNYFDNSFGTVADKAIDGWKEAGYESAEAYYDSFKDRALDLTKKMTGYTVNDKGDLEATSLKNLGLDPTVLMNYQSQFAQISSSMGVSSEYALKLSSAMTRLGADLASIKNEDFETSWKSLTSGLVGMSRAVDKYGISIRNASMQQKLNELGINANISALGQQDKALLRSIIILDESRFAWTDLARTLDQPRNQIRLLSASWANACRSMGALFMGMVAKVVPYINALLIALTRLFQYIGKLFGIEIPTISSQASGGMEDLGDSIGDVGDAIDKTNGSAKKLKSNLLGIDELNIINSDNDGGAGSGLGIGGISGALGDAFDALYDEYDKAWNDAYNKLADKIGKWVDKLIDYFKRGDYYGLGKAIADWLTNALASIDWQSIYALADKIGKGLAQFFNGLIQPELFYQIGRTIAGLINTMFHFIGSFVEEFDWKKAGVSLGQMLQGFVDEIDVVLWAKTISTAITGALEMVGAFLSEAPWREIGYKFGEFIKALDWVGILDGIWDVIFLAFESLLDGFHGLFDASPIAGIIVTAIVGAFSYAKIVPIIEAIGKALSSSKALQFFFGTGEKVGTSVAEGMASSNAMSQAGISAQAIAGHFSTILMGAIIGYHLGDWIATQLYGEEWTLSNNRGVITDYFNDPQMWNETTRGIVRNFEESLRDVNYELDFDFTTGTLDTHFVDIADDIGMALSSIANRGMALNDTDAVMQLLSNDLGFLDDESKAYIQTLSEQYNTLSANARMQLEHAYGIEYVNDGLTNQQYAVDATKDAIARYAQEMGATELQTRSFHSSIDTSVQKYAEQQKALVPLEEKIKTQKDALNATKDAVMQYAQEHGATVQQLDAMASAVDRVGGNLATQVRAIDATKEAVKQYADEQRKAKGITTEVTDGYTEFIQALDESSISADEFSTYVETLSTQDLPSIIESMGEFSNKVTEFNESLPNMKENFETTFEPLNELKDTICPETEEAINSMETTISTQMPIIESAIVTSLTNIQGKMEEVLNWYKDNIEVIFAEGYFDEKLAPMETSFIEITKKICNGIIEVINQMIDKINEGMTMQLSNLTIGGKEVMTASTQKLLSFEHIEGFMNGGFPQKSNLFYANENGTSEFIGRIGGNPAVANNDQIVQAVSNGVYNAVVSAMSDSNNNVNVYLQGDAQGIFKVVRNQDRIYKRQTGSSAFA